MQISTDIQIIQEALWLNKEQILIISDVHIGYEEYLHKKGILIPKQQIKEIIEKLRSIFKNVHPQKIIINGDLKHEFGTILNQEWKEISKLIDFLKENCSELILIKGNHDKILLPIAEKRKIKVVENYQIKDICITHGDKLITTKAKTIIIGHEHPAISLKDKNKVEKYKCFLKGKWQNKELIVTPSFNPLLEGTDIIQEKLLSPFLTKISTFEVWIISKGEIFNFGKIKEIKEEKK